VITRRALLEYPLAFATASAFGAAFGQASEPIKVNVGPYGSTEAAQVAEVGAKALEILRRTISVDVHTHGGPQGIYSPAPPNGNLAAGMRAGSLAAVCLSEIPDEPLLGRNSFYRHYQGQRLS
jgi:hypothetical protein